MLTSRVWRLPPPQVDVSDEAFLLHAQGKYHLELAWPRQIESDSAKAKFVRKSRTLQVTLPLRATA